MAGRSKATKEATPLTGAPLADEHGDPFTEAQLAQIAAGEYPTAAQGEADEGEPAADEG